MASQLDPYSLIGTTFRGRYLVAGFAGVGRFSAVYRAIDASTERAVALRLLKVRDTLTPSQRTIVLERLRALVRPISEAASRCPSLADVPEVAALITSAGRWMPVIVQTWLEGETLESLLVAERRAGARPWSLASTIDLLTPVADALAFAHSLGFVHGSLSPRNVFVLSRARGCWSAAGIVDLGMAQAFAALQAKDGAFTEPPDAPIQFFAATHGSPEHFMAPGHLEPASDVFALALITGELVTGSSPLGEGDDAQLEAAAIDPVTRPTPRVRQTELGAYVEAVFERALALKAKDRYASVSAFWEALRAASRMTTLRPSASPVRAPLMPARPERADERVPARGPRESQASPRRWQSGMFASPSDEHSPPSGRDRAPSSRGERKVPAEFFDTPPPSSASPATNPLFAGEPREKARAR